MSDLKDLYQEIILDHYRSPRHFRTLDEASGHAEGHNPLCGDRVEVWLTLDDGVVRDIGFQGAGCAISTATASLMSEAVLGKSRDEIAALKDRFLALVKDQPTSPDAPELGKLEALGGVREYPMRIKCATLAWHTLAAALEDERGSIVTTE